MNKWKGRSMDVTSGNIDTSNRLPVLAAQINEAHDRSIRSFEATVTSAIAAGDRLLEAKSLLKHGEWLVWLREHCGFSDRTAQNYMRLAKRKDMLGLKNAAAADLTISAALALTDHSLFPLRGFARLWSLPELKEYLFVEESEEAPGHFYATIVRFNRDGDAASSVGMRRPISKQYVPQALLAMEGATSFLGLPFTDIRGEDARDLRSTLWETTAGPGQRHAD